MNTKEEQDLVKLVSSTLSQIHPDKFNNFITVCVQEIQSRRAAELKKLEEKMKEIEKEKNSLRTLLGTAEITNPKSNSDFSWKEQNESK